MHGRSFRASGVVIVFVKKSSDPLLLSSDFARCNDVEGTLEQLALKGCW